MAVNLSTILNFLANPPGDLVYHLLVSLVLAYAVRFVFIKHWKPAKSNQVRTFLIGSSLLLFFQLCLFGLRFYNTSIDFNSAYIYHLFERLASTLTIIWLVWTFLYEDQREIPTNFYIILSLTLLVLVMVSIFIMPRLTQISVFNPLSMDLIWHLIALAMIFIGLMLAVFIRPPQFKILLLILLLFASGHLLQILLMNEMNWYMGAVRFAHILGLPWLLTLPKYFSADNRQISSESIPSETSVNQKKFRPQTTLKRLTSTLPLAKSAIVSWVKSLLERFSKSDQPETLPEINAHKGYPEMTTDIKPALVNLLLKIGLAQSREEKFQTVAQALSLSVIADICFLVSIPAEGDKWHIISGYDLIRETTCQPDTLAREDLPRVKAAWQDQQTLNLSQNDTDVRDTRTLAMLLNYHTIGNLLAVPLGLPGNPLAGGVLFLSPYTGKHWGEKTLQLMEQIKQPLAEVLFAPDPQEKASHASNQAQIKINALIHASEKLRAALAESEAQIREKDTTIKGLKARYQIDKMESVTLIEQMKHKIADLNARITLQSDVATQLEQLQNENRLISSELEQRQQELNRAKSILKDLQTETGQTGPIRLSLENQIISLDSIAANARLRVATQLQKNNIDLEIHNPDGRLMIKTDPELLQTALFELLTNAILASEPGGTIRLEQKLSLEMGMLTIQVTDFGEGLTQAEQTALFSAQHDTIPGIGSVSSIRNAIRSIRVLNGKIWLKSKKVSFTTFRFQIPVRIID